MSKNQHPIIDQNIMKGFYKQIFHYMGKRHCLLTVDIFSVSQYQNQPEKTQSYNYSVPEYHVSILPRFLTDVGTIGLVNKQLERGKYIYCTQNERFLNLEADSLTYNNSTDNYIFEKSCTFDDYIKFLEKNNFGKYCLWINNYNKEKEFKTNVSLLLVFNCNVSKKQLNYIKLLCYKKLLTQGIRITNNKLNELLQNENNINLQAQQLNIFIKQKAEKDHFAHTINNVLPIGISELKSLLPSLRKASVNYNSLENVIKNLTIARLVFQITSDQQPDELKNVSIIDILNILKNNSTAKHKANIINEVTSYNIIKFSEKKICNSIFLLLWNFWHNAEKFSGNRNLSDKIRNIVVRVFSHSNRLAISFENISSKPLKIETKHFLMGIKNRPHEDDYKENGGLVVAKKLVRDLNWSINIPEKDDTVIEEYESQGRLKIKRIDIMHTVSITLITNIPII